MAAMAARLQITDGLRRIMAYPKFVGATRMLVLETGYFFEKSWLRAGAELGWETASVRSVMVGDLTRDDIKELFTVVGEFKPHFVLASNYAGMDVEGIFAHFFADLAIPYVSWFTDTPRMILWDRKLVPSHYQVAATWERAYEPHLRALGFEHVVFMPLATDPTLFHGTPQSHCPRTLAFVGSSMVEQATEAREKVGENPALLAAIDSAFEAGRVTREAFAIGVDSILGRDVFEGLDVRDARHAELYLVYEATRRQREAMVRRMAGHGVEVRGDSDWAAIADRAGGAVGYFGDLGPFYRDTAVNLNITSLQMASAVNQRVFDCPAAGGFLLTDDQGDLHELFREDEIVTFASWEELEDKSGYYVAHPEERVAIIQRAQRRIAVEHTHRQRLEMLEGELRRRFRG